MLELTATNTGARVLEMVDLIVEKRKNCRKAKQMDDLLVSYNKLPLYLFFLTTEPNDISGENGTTIITFMNFQLWNLNLLKTDFHI